MRAYLGRGRKLTPTDELARLDPRFELVGRVSRWWELSAIYRAIILHKYSFLLREGQIVSTKRFHSHELYGVDHAGIRYLEQDPKTASHYAKRSRLGEEIVWVVSLKTGEYLGRVDNALVWAKPSYLEKVRKAQCIGNSSCPLSEPDSATRSFWSS